MPTCLRLFSVRPHRIPTRRNRAFRPGMVVPRLEERALLSAIFVPTTNPNQTYGPTRATANTTGNATKPPVSDLNDGLTGAMAASQNSHSPAPGVTTSSQGAASATLQIPTNQTTGTNQILVDVKLGAQANYQTPAPFTPTNANSNTGVGVASLNNYNFNVTSSTTQPVIGGTVTIIFNAYINPTTRFPNLVRNFAVNTNYFTFAFNAMNGGNGNGLVVSTGTGQATSFNEPNFGPGPGQVRSVTRVISGIPLALAGNFVGFGANLNVVNPFGAPAATQDADQASLGFDLNITIDSSQRVVPTTASQEASTADPAVFVGPITLVEAPATPNARRDRTRALRSDSASDRTSVALEVFGEDAVRVGSWGSGVRYL